MGGLGCATTEASFALSNPPDTATDVRCSSLFSSLAFDGYCAASPEFRIRDLERAILSRDLRSAPRRFDLRLRADLCAHHFLRFTEQRKLRKLIGSEGATMLNDILSSPLFVATIVALPAVWLLVGAR